jgi:hypothetical protein
MFTHGLITSVSLYGMPVQRFRRQGLKRDKMTASAIRLELIKVTVGVRGIRHRHVSRQHPAYVVCFMHETQLAKFLVLMIMIP